MNESILRPGVSRLIRVRYRKGWIALVEEDKGLGGIVGLTLPLARAERGSRPVHYLPCSDLGQVVNLSLSVA